jgi:hypothetical protein
MGYRLENYITKFYEQGNDASPERESGITIEFKVTGNTE